MIATADQNVRAARRSVTLTIVVKMGLVMGILIAVMAFWHRAVILSWPMGRGSLVVQYGPCGGIFAGWMWAELRVDGVVREMPSEVAKWQREVSGGGVTIEFDVPFEVVQHMRDRQKAPTMRLWLSSDRHSEVGFDKRIGLVPTAWTRYVSSMMIGQYDFMNGRPELQGIEVRVMSAGVSLPLWVLAAGLGVSLMRPLIRLRSLTRRLEGVCNECGYDLRATAERCPECGGVVVGNG